MIRLAPGLLQQIEADLEGAYPEEGAGLLLGTPEPDGAARVIRLLPLTNRWEDGDRVRRYRLDPRDLLQAEDQADEEGLSVLGVFHSHPDHPPVPSAFDLDHALPFFAYLITSIEAGRAAGSRAWRLSEDRRRFIEESLDASADPEELR